jgi:hypothetical protein
MLPTIFVRDVAACAEALVAIAILSACAAGSAGPPASTPAADPPPIAWDTDNDGTVDWAETKAAALANFPRLDTDHDGTIDAKEIAVANVDSNAFDKADVDRDGTLTKDEFVALVHERFKAADRDNDGTVSVAELQTSEGRALAALVT